jgi:hypothetical protein
MKKWTQRGVGKDGAAIVIMSGLCILYPVVEDGKTTGEKNNRPRRAFVSGSGTTLATASGLR